jgi:hypothetical protein
MRRFRLLRRFAPTARNICKRAVRSIACVNDTPLLLSLAKRLGSDKHHGRRGRRRSGAWREAIICA